MSWPSIKDIAINVNSGQQTAINQVNKAFALIEKSIDFNVNISLIKERAIERALQIDQQVKKGKPAGILAGVPFIAKDNFLTLGSATTAGSNMLKNFQAPYQSTAINRLEAEGAICVAKGNLDAFGHGASTENSDFFTTYNPADKQRVAGGSSGGPAAAVALKMVPFSLGTDTGGSIRLPASFCGVVGFKPTYGLVSRSGVVAMASSTDCIGAMASNVEDTALVMEVISGVDSLDSTTIDVADNKFSDLKPIIKQPRIGIIKEYLEEGIDPEVKKAILKAADKLSDNGAIISEVSLPSLPLALAVYYVLCPAEVASNLSRYDGLKYGYNDPNTTSLDASYKHSRSNGFGKEAKRRIMIGTYVLSSGYYDAYYKRAQIVRTKLINEFKATFNKVDFLLGPTSATTAFKVGEFVNDPLSMYLNDLMTVAPSLVGIPAIVVSAGKANSLPVGLQLMAAQRKDHDLLNYANSIEVLINA
jgi:aspartyl-tRNA(Asn)/glutamyl-tRNA(Gln) amidotransferase subunit A